MDETIAGREDPCAGIHMDLYVPRQVGDWSDNHWVEWASGSHPGKRLLSIFGPPGSGKTWFICHLRQLFENQDILTLFLNAHSVVATGPDRWLRGVLETFSALSTGIQSLQSVYTNSVDFWVIWPEFVARLCQEKVQVVLLIDGFDEIRDEEYQSRVERDLIHPFLYYTQLRDAQACTRIVIARREGQVLSTDLRWDDLSRKLKPLEPSQAQTQIDLRLGEITESLAAEEPADSLRKALELPGIPAEEIRVENVRQAIAAFEETENLNASQWSTANPYVNNRLLAEFLGAIDSENDPEAWQSLLAWYLQRADLFDKEYPERHRELRHTLSVLVKKREEEDWSYDPQAWTLFDYRKLRELLEKEGQEMVPFDSLQPAFDAGIILLQERTRRYYLDPTFVYLSQKHTPQVSPESEQIQ